MKLFQYSKDLWRSPIEPLSFFQIDPHKVYSDEEIIRILQEERVSVGLGNTIVLVLILRMRDRIKELEEKIK